MPVHLTIEPADRSPGRTPLRLLTRMFSGVQALAYELGKARVASDPEYSGRSDTDVNRECELFLVDARTGSFEVTLDVAGAAPGLFEEYQRRPLGQTVLQDMDRVFAAVGAENERALTSVIPDASRRARVLRALSLALPDRSSDYKVRWAGSSDRQHRVLYRLSRDMVMRLAEPPDSSAGPPSANEVLVEGTAITTLGKDGRPSRRCDWIDYTIIGREDIGPYRTSRITWRDRTFLLKREIACDVSVENRLVVIEFKPLGLRAYAPTREAALQDFAEEFAFAWDYYVGTADSALTNDALKLKRQLLSLVKEVVTGETPQGSQRSPRPGA